MPIKLSDSRNTIVSQHTILLIISTVMLSQSYTFAFLWCKIEVIWTFILHLKGHKYYNLGFLAPNRYKIDLSNEVLNIHFDEGAAKISEVKFGDRKKICQFSLTLGAADSNLAALANFFLTSEFGLWYFCSLFIHNSIQYLIWTIYFISVCRQKPKVMAWLLRWVMLVRITSTLNQKKAKI